MHSTNALRYRLEMLERARAAHQIYAARNRTDPTQRGMAVLVGHDDAWVSRRYARLVNTSLDDWALMCLVTGHDPHVVAGPEFDPDSANMRLAIRLAGEGAVLLAS